MGGSKPKAVQTPFQQAQSNTYSYMSPLNSGSPGVQDFLNVPLNFGDPNAYTGEGAKSYTGAGSNAYTGDAYKSIPTDFNVDPGVGRRTDLAEQSARNNWNSAFMGGVPSFIRQANQDKALRDVRSQGAAEAQQAQYQNQQARNAALTTKAQLQDQSELNKANLLNSSDLARAQLLDQSEQARANMGNQQATQQTLADLQRRQLLLPQLVQTGGNQSGYNTQIMPGQQGIFGQLLQGAGSAVGGLAAGGFL